MNVGAIVYEYPSHTETFVRAQLTGLRQLGCKVQVFADSPDRRAAQMGIGGDDVEDVTYFGLPFKSHREKYGTALSTSSEPPRIQRHSALGRIAANLRVRIEARAFRHASQVEVVSAHFGPNGVRAVRLRRIGAISRPIATFFYGYDVGRSWAREGYDMLFEEGDCFVALSERMKSQLLEMGCPADRLVVHPLGIDPDEFGKGVAVESKTIRIVSVARLVPKKGLEDGIRAAAILKSRNVDFTYTIAGDGPLRKSLSDMIHARGLGDRVRIVGALHHGRIPDLLAHSDVLLAPSVTAPDGDAEGTPVAILEASASRLPVVATRHAGIPEIIDDGASGYLVEERDSEGMADWIVELARDPSLREKMGHAGRALVEARHDTRILSRNLLALLERVRDGRKPHSPPHEASASMSTRSASLT
jgi:colanic acid/amylovoran biosynthesis glycosyltransferase